MSLKTHLLFSLGRHKQRDDWYNKNLTHKACPMAKRSNVFVIDFLPCLATTYGSILAHAHKITSRHSGQDGGSSRAHWSAASVRTELSRLSENSRKSEGNIINY